MRAMPARIMSHSGKQKGGSFDAAALKKSYQSHSGARAARTRNLEIPGLVLRTIPE
jgi:hypothetical protein